MRHALGRRGAVAMVIVLALTSGACSAETSGSRVDIGGRSLFINCRGTGSLTVILEAGLTSDTSSWDDVIDPIAEFTRVCAYDRANNGQSDPIGLHSGDQNVRDLARLLDAEKIEPPYVLVAWSFGGPIARLYAARHPEDVAGMVLVDTDPEDYRSLGDRLVPDDVRERSYWASENDEKLDLDATLDLVRAESKPGSFGDRPLVILTPKTPNSGEIGTGGSQGLPGVRVAELDTLYLRLQEAMKALSSDAREVLVEDSGHCIQCDQPQVVIDAVREVVESSTRQG